jgi:copper(I)-binding protein
MPRRLAVSLVLVTASLFGCGADDKPTAGTITTSEASIAATDTKPSTERVYVALTITSSTDDRLVAASAPPDIAARVVVEGVAVGSDGHLGHLDTPGGTADSDTVSSNIVLPGGTPVELAAGVGQLFLEQPAKQFTAGDQFTLTLTFASGATHQVSVTTRPAAEATGITG